MGFFLETVLGGLMTGMLYSLVALGFVLIFKASGVFNFAQGAMVLFAALAMARFSEWLPRWLGFQNPWVANALAFVVAGVLMFAVAWLVERLVLRHLVNQEAATLLMATLGIAYLLDALQQLVKAHVRFEERVFFPYLEQEATPGQLILMGLELDKHAEAPSDDFLPAFWA